MVETEEIGLKRSSTPGAKDESSDEIEPKMIAIKKIPRNSGPVSVDEMAPLDGNSKKADEDTEDDGGAILCGIGSYRPKYIQRFASPKWMLFWLCWFCLIQGVIVSGLVPAVMTTIERRYNFRAATLGYILQAYEIGYVIFCIPVSYFGGRHSKTLCLGLGLLTMALGSLLFSVPHIVSGLFVHQSKNMSVGECSNGTKTASNFQNFSEFQQFSPLNTGATFLSSRVTCDSEEENNAAWRVIVRSRYAMLFSFANFLHGVGTTPLFTLGVSYIDENVKPTLSPLFVGIFYSCLVFGPAIGFSLAAVFSKFHVDFLRIGEMSMHEVDESDPNWVGAWWVGFQIGSVLALLAVFPIISFPRVLPGALKYQKARIEQSKLSRFESSERVDEEKVATENVEDQAKIQPIWKGLWEDLKHIPGAMKRVLSNASYMCITMSAAVEGLLVAGLSSFMSKYLERQFNIPSSRANLMIGVVMVPFAGLGVLGSGFIVKHFSLTCTKTIKFCLVMSVINSILSPMFLVYCTPTKLIGIELDYDTVSPLSAIKLRSSCNSFCNCDERAYVPVCATSPNGKRFAYFSSCYAGCSENHFPKQKAYSDCSCTLSNSTISAGWCEPKCSALTFFMILFAPMIYCTFSLGVPLLSVVLRCVDYEERPFALGIQWILIRLIGMIPAPAIFGWLFDLSCLVRKKHNCEEESESAMGSCYVYDNKMLADLFLAFALIGKTISCIFLFLALIFFRRSGRKDVCYADDAAESNKLAATVELDNLETAPNKIKGAAVEA